MIRISAAFKFSAAALLALTYVCASAEQGLIVMRVRGVELNNVAEPIGVLAIATYTLLNLKTRKVVWWSATSHVLVLEADAGTYCLASVGYQGLQSQYCGEPYFRVSPGMITNVGEWRYGFYFAESAV